jgi:hypothetical protein
MTPSPRCPADGIGAEHVLNLNATGARSRRRAASGYSPKVAKGRAIHAPDRVSSIPRWAAEQEAAGHQPAHRSIGKELRQRTERGG